ncbi:MAG: hypothetical protein Q9168_008349 [Polycauliona sp. 1 TL-2023]
MPSPAALAKLIVAVMITPFNQDVANDPHNPETINLPLNTETTARPLHRQDAAFTLHEQGNGDTTLVYGNRYLPLNTGRVRVTRNSGIYMCVDGGFQGYCRYFSNPFGQCTNLDGDLAHKVSAAGPDKGSWCTLYA